MDEVYVIDDELNFIAKLCVGFDDIERADQDLAKAIRGANCGRHFSVRRRPMQFFTAFAFFRISLRPEFVIDTRPR
jgi:hypothetical protein